MKRKKNIAVVHCSGGAKQNEGIDFAALPKDCNQILEQYPDGIHSCSYGCLGGGSCVDACKLHALTINEKGVAEVDRDQCVGCGLCVKACPKHLISLEARRELFSQNVPMSRRPQMQERPAHPAVSAVRSVKNIVRPMPSM